MFGIKIISILGCGWYGFPLALKLLEDGYKIKVSSTTEDKLAKFHAAGLKPFKVNFQPDFEVYDPDFFDCDLLIISIPPKRRASEAELYSEKINRVKSAILKYRIKQAIFISSTSVYGDCNREVNEQDLPIPDTASGKAMLEAEKILNNSAYKLSIIRFGGPIGPGRDPATFFAGKKNIPNGKAPVNLLHLDDGIGVTRTVIKHDAIGIILNACSHSHPAKMEFYSKASLNSGLEVPQFIEELKDWKIVSSKLAENILEYRFSTI